MRATGGSEDGELKIEDGNKQGRQPTSDLQPSPKLRLGRLIPLAFAGGN